ncbi:MAG: hypothetical protein LBM26_00700, partial [Methanobrevibacter sp.]|nr:hypothetical protein [Methanobrevibacter sp.]
LEQEFFKSQHRVDISKKLLFEASMEIAILKRIINDFENMGNIDFIKNKKPNSLIYYNKNYNQKNYK